MDKWTDEQLERFITGFEDILLFGDDGDKAAIDAIQAELARRRSGNSGMAELNAGIAQFLSNRVWKLEQELAATQWTLGDATAELTESVEHRDELEREMAELRTRLQVEQAHSAKQYKYLARAQSRVDLLLDEVYRLRGAKKRQGWISVEERLPDAEPGHSWLSVDVLVYCDTEYEFVGYIGFSNKTWYSSWSGEETDHTVTHWLPLPPPPAKDDRGPGRTAVPIKTATWSDEGELPF